MEEETREALIERESRDTSVNGAKPRLGSSATAALQASEKEAYSPGFRQNPEQCPERAGACGCGVTQRTPGNRKGKAGGTGGRPRSPVEGDGKWRPNVYMHGQVIYDKKSEGRPAGDSPLSLRVVGRRFQAAARL